MPHDRTSLYGEHLRLGARMMDFAGWEMPLQYQGIIAEHRAVRTAGGMFDVSHMVRLWVGGELAADLLQSLLTSDTALLTPGAAQYTLLCREDGGILDDLVLFRVDYDRFLWVGNAANRERDRTWLEQHNASPAACQIEDHTFRSTMVALQGPASAELLQPLTPLRLDTFPRFSCAAGSVAGVPCLVSRTGYTGEDGFELVASADDGPTLWRALLAAGAVPCGLGARDTLRLEAGYVLYGEDIDETTNPVEAGLAWAVDLAKGDFVGRRAIERVMRDGPQRKLVGLEMVGRGLARSGYLILHDGQPVGRVTSGRYSPTGHKSIALGYVPPRLAKTGTRLTILAREKAVEAVVVRKPFYRAPQQRH